MSLRLQDAVSQMPERFYVAEIIQEKMFKQYREEIPYSTTVRGAGCSDLHPGMAACTMADQADHATGAGDCVPGTAW